MALPLACSITCSGCDNCNEWFHGDCIRITEKMAKAIREWYCRECRGEACARAGKAGGLHEMKRSHQWEGSWGNLGVLCGQSDCWVSGGLECQPPL